MPVIVAATHQLQSALRARSCKPEPKYCAEQRADEGSKKHANYSYSNILLQFLIAGLC